MRPIINNIQYKLKSTTHTSTRNYNIKNIRKLSSHKSSINTHTRNLYNSYTRSNCRLTTDEEKVPAAKFNARKNTSNTHIHTRPGLQLTVTIEQQERLYSASDKSLPIPKNQCAAAATRNKRDSNQNTLRIHTKYSIHTWNKIHLLWSCSATCGNYNFPTFHDGNSMMLNIFTKVLIFLITNYNARLR